MPLQSCNFILLFKNYTIQPSAFTLFTGAHAYTRRCRNFQYTVHVICRHHDKTPKTKDKKNNNDDDEPHNKYNGRKNKKIKIIISYIDLQLIVSNMCFYL